MKTFDFYFDFGSLAAYLAHTQLPKMCAETGASANLLPMLLGGVFQATGNVSPMTVPAKGRYVFVDFKRYADGYGVPLNMNPNFPIITTTLMRMVTALQMHKDPRMQTLMDTVFQAIWVDSRNLNDPVTVGQVLTDAGFDAATLLAMANEQATKDQLKAVTMKAVERGVFGAPTFFVGEDMFWGQDRMEQVKAALKA
ncbi:2-hydroxychromene-2-carboxylate isomerase [Limnohabitans sp. Rim8]|jgi:2-hydroxychromene-2-carboxylate isomerase|uniref:2-hydroxychromene-2-carboxylate isomerase n=1 Tax=Limnohabitans sp. Rim8 TaxID=1100718 RepID=UPI0025E4F754|nr:2-hydroxychromene-2-carboxylate isomerase [Limnohabitans sp. Rim8]